MGIVRHPFRGGATSQTKPDPIRLIPMKLILTLSALVISASLALAAEGDKPKKPEGGKPGEGKRPNPEEMFKKVDANGDGSISKDEFKAAPFAQKEPDKAEKMFAFKDADKDGKLSKEEFAKRPEGKGGKPGQPGKGGDAPKKP